MPRILRASRLSGSTLGSPFGVVSRLVHRRLRGTAGLFPPVNPMGCFCPRTPRQSPRCPRRRPSPTRGTNPTGTATPRGQAIFRSVGPSNIAPVPPEIGTILHGPKTPFAGDRSQATATARRGQVISPPPPPQPLVPLELSRFPGHHSLPTRGQTKSGRARRGRESEREVLNSRGCPFAIQRSGRCPDQIAGTRNPRRRPVRPPPSRPIELILPRGGPP